MIQEAVAAGSRVGPACQEAEICLRTYRRWIKAGGPVLADQRPEAQRPAPQNKLSDAEIKAILAICHQAQYASLPPSQIVPKLADQGLYRVLHSHDQ